ncbi:CBS domain-containing protein [Shouchella miscanthi]|uniref:CBS domain-containing protein n=1 Tax=Shouchella miscanthi TaxID=2598861 RepID=UPI0011A4D468|nr:CBS domain-containing protein [Shouchella miscanthi]
MRLIVSHTNLDFDGLASLVAAHKFDPKAVLALPPSLGERVKQFLHFYSDSFDWYTYKQIDWSNVSAITYVDCSTDERAGVASFLVNNEIERSYIDHHQSEATGANITLLLQPIIHQGIAVSPIEATLFGLGLYSDTNRLTNDTVTIADMKAAVFLHENGMDLTVIREFLQAHAGEHPLFKTLFNAVDIQTIAEKRIVFSTCIADQYIADIATVVEEIHSLYAPDATIVLCQLHHHTYMIARATSADIPIQILAQQLGGNGHDYAASAICRNEPLAKAYATVRHLLTACIQVKTPIRSIMHWPVQTFFASSTVAEVFHESNHLPYKGFPVVNDRKQVIGMLTAAKLKKAIDLNQGTELVASIMSKKVLTLKATDSIEQGKKVMMENEIGRIPICQSDGTLEGIITRSSIITSPFEHPPHYSDSELTRYFGEKRFTFLRKIGELADAQDVQVYIVGGIVRDFILNRLSKDIDLVVEGDAISFARTLANQFGGEVQQHDHFLTATWIIHSVSIDLVTARREHYRTPGALPDVQAASIKDDLARRDFAINAIAVSLNASCFGEILDPFQGRQQIQAKTVSILHPLSFIEDPTRLFRALRFAKRLGFQLGDETKKQAKIMGHAIQTISKQRLYHELELSHREDQLPWLFKALNEYHVWKIFFGANMSENAYKHIQHLFREGVNESIFLAIAAIAYEQHSLESLHAFALTKLTKKLLTDIQLIEDYQDETSLDNLHGSLFSVKDAAIFFFITLPNKENSMLSQYRNAREMLTPLVTGRDLIALGFKPSPLFSTWLLDIEKRQLTGEIKTKADALAWVSKKNKHES